MDLHLIAPHTLAQEAASLSSGTLATLTGYRDYALIDEVQGQFVAFCRKHPTFPTWQDAWESWQTTKDPKASAPRKPVQQRLEFGFTLEG